MSQGKINYSSIDAMADELAPSVIDSLMALYSREKYKENPNLSLLTHYEKTQEKLKGAAQSLVATGDKERDLIIEKYGKLYRDKRVRLEEKNL